MTEMWNWQLVAAEMEMGQWVMGHSQWPIDPWWNNTITRLPTFVFLHDWPLFSVLTLFLVDIKKLLTHSIRPIIIAGGLILIYDFFALKTERVVQYHHATPSPSPMRRMKWCNAMGHGSRKMTHFHLCVADCSIDLSLAQYKSSAAHYWYIEAWTIYMHVHE